MKWSTSVVVAFAAAACASIGIGDGDDHYRRTVTLDGASYDEAWTAVIETFQDLELPISTLEKESGLVATDWILLRDPSRYMECDATARDQEGRYNVFLKGESDPEMTITSSYRAVLTEGGASVHCRTTEAMEEEIQRRVRDKVD